MDIVTDPRLHRCECRGCSLHSFLGSRPPLHLRLCSRLLSINRCVFLRTVQLYKCKFHQESLLYWRLRRSFWNTDLPKMNNFKFSNFQNFISAVTIFVRYENQPALCLHYLRFLRNKQAINNINMIMPLKYV